MQTQHETENERLRSALRAWRNCLYERDLNRRGLVAHHMRVLKDHAVYAAPVSCSAAVQTHPIIEVH